MKYEALMRYCPVTKEQKGWEIPLGEFDTEQQTKEFLDKEVPEMQKSAAWKLIGNRILFFIKQKEDPVTPEQDTTSSG